MEYGETYHNQPTYPLESEGVRPVTSSVQEGGRKSDESSDSKSSGGSQVGEIPESFVRVRFEDLEFCEKCGEGSFGSVFRAKWLPQGKKEVAVKKIHHMDKEAHILSVLSHRNIIQFYGACAESPNYCIVTEFAPYGSLFDFLSTSQSEKMEFMQLLAWSRDIAMGMNYLHEEAPVTVIHRDLKSKNVVICKDFTLKLCDFGASRFFSETVVMTVTGTYPWMAPEMIQGLPTSELCDVYSFAVVLWELLTREVPFKGLQGFQVAWAVVENKERPPVPTSCPKRFSDLMQTCWGNDAESRPPFHEVVAQLNSMLNDEQLSEETNIFLREKEQWMEDMEEKLGALRSQEKSISGKQEELRQREERVKQWEEKLKEQMRKQTLVGVARYSKTSENLNCKISGTGEGAIESVKNLLSHIWQNSGVSKNDQQASSSNLDPRIAGSNPAFGAGCKSRLPALPQRSFSRQDSLSSLASSGSYPSSSSPFKPSSGATTRRGCSPGGSPDPGMMRTSPVSTNHSKGPLLESDLNYNKTHQNKSMDIFAQPFGFSEFPRTSPKPHEFPRTSPKPHEFPRTSPKPHEFPRTSPKPHEFPRKNSRSPPGLGEFLRTNAKSPEDKSQWGFHDNQGGNFPRTKMQTQVSSSSEEYSFEGSKGSRSTTGGEQGANGSVRMREPEVQTWETAKGEAKVNRSNENFELDTDQDQHPMSSRIPPPLLGRLKTHSSSPCILSSPPQIGGTSEQLSASEKDIRDALDVMAIQGDQEVDDKFAEDFIKALKKLKFRSQTKGGRFKPKLSDNLLGMKLNHRSPLAANGVQCVTETNNFSSHQKQENSESSSSQSKMISGPQSGTMVKSENEHKSERRNSLNEKRSRKTSSVNSALGNSANLPVLDESQFSTPFNSNSSRGRFSPLGNGGLASGTGRSRDFIHPASNLDTVPNSRGSRPQTKDWSGTAKPSTAEKTTQVKENPANKLCHNCNGKIQVPREVLPPPFSHSKPLVSTRPRSSDRCTRDNTTQTEDQCQTASKSKSGAPASKNAQVKPMPRKAKKYSGKTKFGLHTPLHSRDCFLLSGGEPTPAPKSSSSSQKSKNKAPLSKEGIKIPKTPKEELKNEAPLPKHVNYDAFGLPLFEERATHREEPDAKQTITQTISETGYSPGGFLRNRRSLLPSYYRRYFSDSGLESRSRYEDSSQGISIPTVVEGVCRSSSIEEEPKSSGRSLCQRSFSTPDASNSDLLFRGVSPLRSSRGGKSSSPSCGRLPPDDDIDDVTFRRSSNASPSSAHPLSTDSGCDDGRASGSVSPSSGHHPTLFPKPPMDHRRRSIDLPNSSAMRETRSEAIEDDKRGVATTPTPSVEKQPIGRRHGLVEMPSVTQLRTSQVTPDPRPQSRQSSSPSPLQKQRFTAGTSLMMRTPSPKDTTSDPQRHQSLSLHLQQMNHQDEPSRRPSLPCKFLSEVHLPGQQSQQTRSNNSRFPIKNVPDTSFPIKNVSDAGNPIRNISDTRLPIKNVSDTSFPIKNVSDAGNPIRNISEGVLPIKNAAGGHFPVQMHKVTNDRRPHGDDHVLSQGRHSRSATPPQVLYRLPDERGIYETDDFTYIIRPKRKVR